MQLIDLGFNPFFDAHFEPHRNQGLSAVRIIREDRDKYIALGESGELNCTVSGKFRFETGCKGKFPAVGDWVAVSARPEEGKATIQAVLPRKSFFSRKVAGQKTDEQVVAANMDIVFIVCGLDLNYNLRRIERYLSLAWESGADTVVLLNKTDLCPETEDRKKEVESIALGVEAHAISATLKVGLESVQNRIGHGKTAVFLGSSGAGKSTIINALLGVERLRVNEVIAAGSRGRHTTTFRELMLLPNGGMVIDTPGMRELQVWGDEEGLERAFGDVEALASKCRFRDCTHQSEPGCAVQAAVSDGSLDQGRLNSYFKLKKEFVYLADRLAMKPNAIEKARWKKISRQIKNLEGNKT